MTPSDLALVRYQAISAYLADDPPRGRRRATLERLAARTWMLEDGTPVTFAAETLRGYVRRYRAGGLAALEDQPRPQRGVVAMTPEQVEVFCQLKEDVPERSLDRLLLVAADLGLVEAGAVSRSTLHRALQARGLSGRPRSASSTKDLDRFEAAAPNHLWQSDMLHGPWLPDPQRPGRSRQAHLYAFLDDHSRLLLSGRWSFKGDLPALELVFRDALRRYGVPRRVYYDNGATYRSGHMRQVAAELNIHAVVFTEAYRPEGHGKIEAFNRICRSGFVAEVKASAIQTLDELNRAFRAWVERYYNAKVHAELHEAPRARYEVARPTDPPPDEEVLRRAFLWKEDRRTDKTGLFSLFGTRYQTGPALAKKKITVLYDPERLDEVEVWHDKRFRERVRPFSVQVHRRPEDPSFTQPVKRGEPVGDWLGTLVQDLEDGVHADPDRETRRALHERRQLDDAFVALLRDLLDPAVFDEDTVRGWLDRFGPTDTQHAAELLELSVGQVGATLHVQHYLDMLYTAFFGENP